MSSICLSPEGMYTRSEANASVAGILPGHIVEVTTGLAFSAADEPTASLAVADINIGDAGDIDTAYVLNENVHFVYPSKGSLVRFRKASGTAFAKGDQLAANSNGEVKAPAAANVGVKARVHEAAAVGESYVIGRVI